jgi:orotidine-5'-phosphate decarboxylase
MGSDSVLPFLEFPGKFVILLALTSNTGASDFQYLTGTSKKPLFTEVIEKSQQWGNKENMMYVVGATKASMLVNIRQSAPEHFLLVPGVGAQGGSLAEVAEYGMTSSCGLIINASRSILFAGRNKDFDTAAAAEAKTMQQEMQQLLAKNKIIGE